MRKTASLSCFRKGSVIGIYITCKRAIGMVRTGMDAQHSKRVGPPSDKRSLLVPQNNDD